jgi:hypothetical protein
MNRFIDRDHEIHCNTCDENLAPGNQFDRLGFLLHFLGEHDIEVGLPLAGLDRLFSLVDRALIRGGVLVIPADVPRVRPAESQVLQ